MCKAFISFVAQQLAMKPSQLSLLFELSRKTGKATTTQLAGKLSCSQQTISRWLQELEKQGFVEKKRGDALPSTEGNQFLDDLCNSRGKNRVGQTVLRGTVFSGLKQAKFFLSQKNYALQFKKALGFTPYPGTLNLRLDSQSAEAKKALENAPGIAIKGFRQGNRQFFGAKCVFATANNTPCAVILPEKTHYSREVIELIAVKRLRTSLKLKDGSQVAVSLQPQ